MCATLIINFPRSLRPVITVTAVHSQARQELRLPAVRPPPSSLCHILAHFTLPSAHCKFKIQYTPLVSHPILLPELLIVNHSNLLHWSQSVVFLSLTLVSQDLDAICSLTAQCAVHTMHKFTIQFSQYKYYSALLEWPSSRTIPMWTWRWLWLEGPISIWKEGPAKGKCVTANDKHAWED